jgi:deoxyribodipyrimidine photo-lyase
MKQQLDPLRVISQSNKEVAEGPIIYWMSRDQRVYDNWALLYAAEQAIQSKQKLEVVFCLQPKFLEATLRQFDFMLKGLQEVEAELRKLKIPFQVLVGEPVSVLSSFVKEEKVGLVVADFSPLKIARKWKNDVAAEINCKLVSVDTHNIIPITQASNKQEYAARTIRPKIHKKLDIYLTEFPNTLLKQIGSKNNKKTDWKSLYKKLEVDTKVTAVETFSPGSAAAQKMLDSFIEDRLDGYDEKRNDPNQDSISNLSPYLHFGQISAQRIALEVTKATAPKKDKDAYLEELIVRRELSDNFCYFNKNYDSVEGFPAWAKKTLFEHKNDKREYVYTKEEFEQAKTHDQLWNAAQRQMVQTGKMHGYMRMYWAKKILEWTNTPEFAMEVAIYLNDKYELDGRDPNGYVGVAWSIGGVHDRTWFERPIFGKIRFMAESGCRRKFDVDAYISSFSQ